MRAVLAALAVSIAMPAHGQSYCASRDVIASVLSDRFDEAPVARGIVGEGNMMEVFAAEDGSWTIVVTVPTGRACITASGESYHAVAAEKPGEEM